MQTYLVGGAVRDYLLGLPVKDRDWVVVGADAQTMLAQGFQPVGKDFPVFLHPETHEEYALARTERKTAKGYVGFSFHADKDVTLEQDLMRRDLTINAMAQDADGKIIDLSADNGIWRQAFCATFPQPLPKTPSASCVLPALPRVTSLKSPKKP